MALINEIFPLIMTDMERGATILRNLSYLTADISSGATSWTLRDGTGADLFGANDVIVDSEDILVGAVNAITREQNGTTGAIHKNGAVVRLKGGATVATFTFTGGETITGIWVSGNGPAMYQIKCGSAFGPMKYTGGYGQEVFLPFSGITPQNGDTITILGWTNLASLNCWAYTTR